MFSSQLQIPGCCTCLWRPCLLGWSVLGHFCAWSSLSQHALWGPLACSSGELFTSGPSTSDLPYSAPSVHVCVFILIMVACAHYAHLYRNQQSTLGVEYTLCIWGRVSHWGLCLGNFSRPAGQWALVSSCVHPPSTGLAGVSSCQAFDISDRGVFMFTKQELYPWRHTPDPRSLSAE